MLLLGERPSYVDQIAERLRMLSAKLFEDLPQGTATSLSKTQDLYALESSENMFIIKNGTLSAHSDDRLCFYYEAGDIVGLTECYKLPSLRIAIEDNVDVEQYSADVILRHVNESKEKQAIWTSYLVSLISLYQDAFGRNQFINSKPNTGFLSFAPGQTIINQGDDAFEVFTILSGKADVFVDDKKVGEVLQDEIFGAMAVFTGEQRSATVKASTECSVLAVPKDEFITLIQSHPQTTMTLIENMASSIRKLNEQVTAK